MKTRLLLLAMAIVPLSYSIAQDKDTTVHYPTVSVGLNAAPEISSLTTASVPQTSVFFPRLGYTIGVPISIQLSKAFSLETGIQLTHRRFSEFRSNNLDSLNMLTLSNSLYYLPQLRHIHSSYTLSVPLKVNFSVGSGKWRFCGGVGLAFDLVAYSNQSLMSLSQGMNAPTPFTDWHATQFYPALSLVASAGVAYQISDRALLKIEPTFRYQLTSPALKSTPGAENILKSHPFNVGINTTLLFRTRP